MKRHFRLRHFVTMEIRYYRIHYGFDVDIVDHRAVEFGDATDRNDPAGLAQRLHDPVDLLPAVAGVIGDRLLGGEYLGAVGISVGG